MTNRAGGAPLMRPIITEKGFAAASQAATLGVPVKITHIGLTATGGAGAETDESLPNAQILPIADGKVISSWQVNVSALLPDTFQSMEIKGIAFYLEDGTMFATYRKTEAIISHTGGTTLLIGMDFVMSNIPPESVTVESTEANLVLGDWVPVQRRVNGKGLNADIILNANDVNAAPSGFGLGGAATALGSGSCNDAVMTGWYGINNATTDTPFGTGQSGSAMQVVRWGGTAIHQVFYDYIRDRTYTRRLVGGAWQGWVMMYNTANPPPAADLSAYVPKTRKVNNKALDADITLSASDVGAAPSSHSHSNYVPTTRTVNDKALSSDVTLTAADVGAAPSSHSHSNYVPTTRTVNDKALSSDVTLTAADVGALSLSEGGTVTGQTIHTGLTAFVNEKIKFYAGSGTHHNIQAVGADLHFTTGSSGETLRMAIMASGEVEFGGKVVSNYANSREWSQVGNSCFYSSRTRLSPGYLSGLASGLVDISGVSTYEHGYGFLAGSSGGTSAHALFCNGGGGYNQVWLFRNDGQIQAPSGWLIDSAGNLSGSTWGGNLKTWVVNNFAPKITNVNQIHSLAFACLPVGQGDASWGSTISGTLLRPAAAAGNMQSVGLTGTWMCCGSLSGANNDGVQDDRTTLWMRIS